MTLAISVELIYGLGLFGLWIWDRKKMKSDVARLARGLTVSNSTTHAFMKECEVALAEIFRLISKAESHSNPSVKAEDASQANRLVMGESSRESKLVSEATSPYVELAPISGKDRKSVV